MTSILSGANFMPMAFEIYGTCAEKFESFLKKMVKAASAVNHVPDSVLLNYWRKRFSVTLQTFNARLITRAYLELFDNASWLFICKFNKKNLRG